MQVYFLHVCYTLWSEVAGMSKQYKANEGSFEEFALPTSYRFPIPSVPFSNFNSFIAKGNSEQEL